MYTQMLPHTQIITQQNTELQAAELTEQSYKEWIMYLDTTERTAEAYTKNVGRFMQYLSDNGITQPTRNDVISYREKLKADGLKPATIQAYIIAVRQFFTWTETQGIYPNIAIHIIGAKLDRAFKKDYLTVTQARTVIEDIDTDSINGLRDKAIIVLILTTGLRCIEIQRANLEDMRTRGDSTVLYLQGKGHTERTDYVKIEAPAEKAIRAYLKARGQIKGTEPLFASHAHRNNGARMTTRSISRICKEALVNAGFDSDRLTAHSLRHTAGAINLLNGASLEETQILLRHSNISTTMLYSHALERDNNNSEARISKAIFGE